VLKANKKLKMITKMPSYFLNIMPEIFGLFVLIASFYNNPYRFSAENNFLKISHYKMTYLLYAIVIVLQMLVLYCKSFTYLNHTGIYSITLPIILLLIPFLGYLSVTFITKQVFVFDIPKDADVTIYGNISTTKNDVYKKQENTSVSANDIMTNNDFTAPPSYFLNKSPRLFIFFANLLLVMVSLGTFVNYFNTSKAIYKSPLQKLLTSNPEASSAKNLILSVLGILVGINVFMIYQQHTFYPCRLGLPDSWDI
jgi:hypothetical protein